jgi:hypothetical protein
MEKLLEKKYATINELLGGDVFYAVRSEAIPGIIKWKRPTISSKLTSDQPLVHYGQTI